MKIKVLFYTTDDWCFLSHRINLAKELIKNNINVTLLTTISNKKDIIEKEGIKCINITPKIKIPILKEFFTIINIYKYINKNKANILHNVALKPIILGSIASIFIKKIKVINAISGIGSIFINDKKSLKLKSVQFIINKILKKVKSKKNIYTLLQNNDDKEFLNQLNLINLNRTFIIKGSGIDLSEYKINKKKKNNEVTITLPARLLRDKGIYEFVEAAKILKQKYSNLKFNLVGKEYKKNPSSLALKTIKKWEKENLINWLGHQNDMQKIYNETDIVVLPSYREGLPKVLLEAASFEIPIITTNVPGCKEIVINNYNGFLIEKKSIKPLANAIEKLILNKNIMKTQGKNGKKIIIKEFNIKKITNETLTLYEKILK